jgi:hypothetical protein
MLTIKILEMLTIKKLTTIIGMLTVAVLTAEMLTAEMLTVAALGQGGIPRATQNVCG